MRTLIATKFTLAFGVVCLCLVGCSDSGGETDIGAAKAQSGPKSGVPSESDPSTAGSVDEVPIERPAWVEDDGIPRELVETARCCLPGEGRDCCTGQPGEICMAFGDDLGRCSIEGEQIGGKSICPGACCEGLARVPDMKPGTNGCEGAGHLGISVCVSCGDGICGNFENYCNCPEDCSQ